MVVVTVTVIAVPHVVSILRAIKVILIACCCFIHVFAQQIITHVTIRRLFRTLVLPRLLVSTHYIINLLVEQDYVHYLPSAITCLWLLLAAVYNVLLLTSLSSLSVASLLCS